MTRFQATMQRNQRFNIRSRRILPAANASEQKQEPQELRDPQTQCRSPPHELGHQGIPLVRPHTQPEHRRKDVQQLQRDKHHDDAVRNPLPGRIYEIRTASGNHSMKPRRFIPPPFIQDWSGSGSRRISATVLNRGIGSELRVPFFVRHRIARCAAIAATTWLVIWQSPTT